MTVARMRFTAAADEAAKEIKEGKDKGFWFKKLDKGYVVLLKNGAKALDQCSFAVASADDAVKLLNAAKACCGKGGEQFKASARPSRAKQEGEAAALAAAAPTPAPASAKGKRK